MKTHRGSSTPDLGRIEVVIERLAPGGCGVARAGDRALLVPGALAGERALVEVERGNGRDRRAPSVRLLKVVEESADRVAPPCPLVGDCGGCDFMHVAEGRQLELLGAIVREQLAHATRADVPEPALTPAPRRLGYRSRARLAFDARGKRVNVGYRRGRSHDLVPMDACLVLDSRLGPAIETAREILEGSTARGDLGVALGADARPVLDLRPDADLVAAAFGRIEAAVSAGRLAGARVWPVGSSVPVRFGDPRVEQPAVDGAPMRLPAGSFAQPSDEGAAMLAARTRAAVEALVPATARARSRVVELFAGSGTLTIALASCGFAHLTAVELDAAACDEARRNLGARGIEGTVVCADAETYGLDRADVVVLDPPRTGARGAAAKIVAARPRWVTYVSCDPATLARDVEALARAGYVIRATEVVELFPQTSHVETIVALERPRRSS